MKNYIVVSNKKRKKLVAAIIMMILLLSGCGASSKGARTMEAATDTAAAAGAAQENGYADAGKRWIPEKAAAIHRKCKAPSASLLKMWILRWRQKPLKNCLPM